MPSKNIEQVVGPGEKEADGQANLSKLQAELIEAQQTLLEAEAQLTEEQAAVNAFRMHCRLKLDRWVEQLMELQTERQSLLTRLELLRQSEDFGIPLDDAGSFWQGELPDLESPVDEDGEELILPTDVPHDKAAEKRLYRQLARRFHPDLATTAVEIAYRTDMMSAVNTAYTGGDVQTLYDLAGELDPQESAELATIASVEHRRLRQQIIRLRQRQRRAKRRLGALRQENTARLWQKALRLEEKDVHWWEIVRREIDRAIVALSEQVDLLHHEVDRLEVNRSPESLDQDRVDS